MTGSVFQVNKIRLFCSFESSSLCYGRPPYTKSSLSRLSAPHKRITIPTGKDKISSKRINLFKSLKSKKVNIPLFVAETRSAFQNSEKHFKKWKELILLHSVNKWPTFPQCLHFPSCFLRCTQWWWTTNIWNKNYRINSLSPSRSTFHTRCFLTSLILLVVASRKVTLQRNPICKLIVTD